MHTAACSYSLLSDHLGGGVVERVWPEPSRLCQGLCTRHVQKAIHILVQCRVHAPDDFSGRGDFNTCI